MTKLQIFDSTLRDGAQGANISFSVDDKIKVIETLDSWRGLYRGGQPLFQPCGDAVFPAHPRMKLEHANLVAFGSTRRKGISADEDSNLKSLLAANTEYVAIFGKSHIRHVTDVIKRRRKKTLP